MMYCNSEEEHDGHIWWSMHCLQAAGLDLKPENCVFHKETVRYLGLIISTHGISMGEDKIETVQNWSRERKTNNG